MLDLDVFFQQARSLRLSPDEFRASRGAVGAWMQTHPQDLQQPEKHDILVTLRSFAVSYPARGAVPTSDHVTFTLPLWRGTNLFRHLQPFLI